MVIWACFFLPASLRQFRCSKAFCWICKVHAVLNLIAKFAINYKAGQQSHAASSTAASYSPPPYAQHYILIQSVLLGKKVSSVPRLQPRAEPACFYTCGTGAPSTSAQHPLQTVPWGQEMGGYGPNSCYKAHRNFSTKWPEDARQTHVILTPGPACQVHGIFIINSFFADDRDYFFCCIQTCATHYAESSFWSLYCPEERPGCSMLWLRVLWEDTHLP